jgi:hypothetical protein
MAWTLPVDSVPRYKRGSWNSFPARTASRVQPLRPPSALEATQARELFEDRITVRTLDAVTRDILLASHGNGLRLSLGATRRFERSRRPGELDRLELRK